MRTTFVILTLLITFTSCNLKVKTEEKATAEKSTDVKIDFIDYDGLELLLNKNDDKTYVINFWATWCKPCVQELPSFEKLNKVYKDKNVEVILVSLDFPNQIEKKVIPFINKHQLQSKVILMNDPDQNEWIPKISKKWSGSIPATLIYNKYSREFYEQSFTYESLHNELNKFLKSK